MKLVPFHKILLQANTCKNETILYFVYFTIFYVYLYNYNYYYLHEQVTT